MKLFRLTNTAGNGIWVFADTEKEARLLFHRAGYVKVAKNAKVSDQTEFYLSHENMAAATKCALKAGVKGTASIQLHVNTWFIIPRIDFGRNGKPVEIGGEGCLEKESSVLMPTAKAQFSSLVKSSMTEEKSSQ